MTTRTSVGNGNWSAAGTWDTGVPGNDETVVIAAGTSVIFDVDQSLFADGINGMTITGTLNFATSGGPYYLKMKAATFITGAGVMNVGTSGAGAIPYATKITITGGAGWYITGAAGLTLGVYAAEPVTKIIYLSGAEAIGQTELSVDTSVVGDLWADGDLIRINDIKAYESEERTIAAGGIAAGAITVTAGLTAAKNAGASVVLISRNVKIIANGTTNNYTLYNFASGKLTIGGGMLYGVATKYFINTCPGAAISGGTISNPTSAGLITVCEKLTITGGVFCGASAGVGNSNHILISGGVFTGFKYALYPTSNNVTISGGAFVCNDNVFFQCYGANVTGGTFNNNNNVFNDCRLPCYIIGGVFSNNTYCIYGSYGFIVTGGTFTGNTNDVNIGTFVARNIAFTSSVEVKGYNFLQARTYSESINHDGDAGALKAWTMGGIVASQTSVKPTGYAIAYLHAVESATWHCFWKKIVTVPAGKTASVEVQLRKDASMTYLPRVYLMAGIDDPLAGNTPADTFTMTDSTDTWESDTFTMDNSAGTLDAEYTLWFVGMNATGNVYSAEKVTMAGGSGGVSRARIIGGV